MRGLAWVRRKVNQLLSESQVSQWALRLWGGDVTPEDIQIIFSRNSFSHS